MRIIAGPLHLAIPVLGLRVGGLEDLQVPFAAAPRFDDLGGHHIDEDLADTMNALLTGVVESGTGTAADIGRPVAGKTGTTNDYKDAWFVGYTGGFVTAVWVGQDDNGAMRRVTGGNVPAGIWKDYMTAALPRLKVQPIPGGVMPEPEPQGPIDQILEGVRLSDSTTLREQIQRAKRAEAAPTP